MAFSLFNPNRPSTLVSILLLIIFHASFYQPSHTFSGYGREITEDGSTRRLFGSKGSTQLPKNCEVLLVHSQCSQNPKCSWCTSEDLEDMCFTKSEAWRLRHQVYSCALIR
ncbi:hypothetical protein TanjilG_21652 [Lupinus angustifolius]|uniref:Uncharacterized protein n=1 Tax=Lupinus angustifolius TaxID=3871 RepID=A0A394DC66_LUPAN|nr:hypothetical protein TanjilG_21652 [Lupinus angustifolius]